jgi:tetratricopeptide (TPR) repeat protein/predicted Ser/Thr protein kinase
MKDVTGDAPTTAVGDADARTRDDVATSGVERGEQVGRYIVVARLGAGGMGDVLLGYDPDLDRRVALKLLRIGRRARADRARERLLREAQALARLSHPAVVQVFDVGTHGDGRVFLAMEHVSGRTLGAWFADDPPHAWREVVDMLCRAGDGLAAAHTAGIVHRDFKPANVMVGEDGRPRVLDFGLARRFDLTASVSVVEEEEADDDEDDDDLHTGPVSVDRSAPLTEAGVVMGTPAYMAPEQFFNEEIDERADQFAFCVTAYRALFGVAPYPGETHEQLARAVERGERSEPKTGLEVPRAIRAALARGLSPRPADRFPDMAQLLVALRAGLRTDRRWKVALAGTGVVAAAVGLGLWARAETTPPCAGVGDEIDAVYDDATQSRIETAFDATGLPFATDAHRTITADLSEYATRWRALREDACVATRVRGDQSPHLMDLRVSCLEERRRELRALIGVLAGADRAVVENGPAAVSRLRPLDTCGDAQRLLSEVPPPEDEATAAAVDDVRDQLAQARAETIAGRFIPASALARPALAQAKTLDYPPLWAEAGALTGMIDDKVGEPKRAVETLDTALWTAIAARDGASEAEALIALVSVVGATLGDADLARRHARHADAVLTRIGDPPSLRAMLLTNSATVSFRSGQWGEAEASLTQALEIVRPAKMTRLHLVALSLLVASHGARGDHAGAAAIAEQGLAVAEPRLGARHPVVGQLLSNRGASRSVMGEYEGAVSDLRRALSIYLETFGPEHPEVGRIKNTLSTALASSGEVEQALTLAIEGLEIKRASLGPDNHAVAMSANNVADILIRTGRPLDSIAYSDDALRIWSQPEHTDKPGIAYGLASRAQALHRLDRVAEALPDAEALLAQLDRLPIAPEDDAMCRLIAAGVLWDAGQHTRAHAVALAARAGYAGTSHPGLAEADAWLQSHPEP